MGLEEQFEELSRLISLNIFASRCENISSARELIQNSTDLISENEEIFREATREACAAT